MAWGSIPDWIVAITAIIASAMALVQLRRIIDANAIQAKAHQDQVSIARAELILEIDARFESAEMQESRLAIRTLRHHCERKARETRRRGAHDGDVATATAMSFSEEMTALFQRFKTPERVADNVEATDIQASPEGERYFLLMRLPYWMESVGELTKSGLLPLEDVLNLYDAAFIGVLGCFEQHIQDRRSDPPLRNERFLENALWLKAQAVERAARLKSQQQVNSKSANLFA